MGEAKRGDLAVHSAGETHSECICGKFQRQVPGRMLERAFVHGLGGGKTENRNMGSVLQHGPATQLAWLCATGNIRN